eukprot:412738-Prymnesium_polylepis.1
MSRGGYEQAAITTAGVCRRGAAHIGQSLQPRLGQLLQTCIDPPDPSLAFVGGSEFMRTLHVAGTPIDAGLIT